MAASLPNTQLYLARCADALYLGKKGKEKKGN